MKWFKHDTDMHTDLKCQALIEKHGLEGYAIWNLCLEMVGKEGHKGKIDGRLRWRQLICKVIGWSDNGKFDEIISTMGEIGLICNKSLKYGNLYIPKFVKRADDYTTRQLRTNYEHDSDNVHAEEKRIDKKRIDTIRNYFVSKKNYLKDSLTSSFYARTGKAITTLLKDSSLNTELVIKGINWISGKNYEWTLETLIKHWADFMKETQGGQKASGEVVMNKL